MVTGLVIRSLEKVRQIVCSMHGHDALLHFETGRLSMRCTSCGYETPGWDLKKSAPARVEAAPKGRLLRLPIVGERRVA